MINLVNDNNRQHIHIFNGILNFRDLGGFRTRDGRTVARGKVFRSGELHHATPGDLEILHDDFKIAAVLDLRSQRRVTQTGNGNLENSPLKRYAVSLELEPEHTRIESSTEFTHMGEMYYFRIRQPEYGRKMVRALEIIADPSNLPVLFHCNAGKDRAGMLAALLLTLLGVADDDIIEDYSLSAAAMEKYLQRLDEDPVTAGFHRKKPAHLKEAVPESMSYFLSAFKAEYGSAEKYLRLHGAGAPLISRLKELLLV